VARYLLEDQVGAGGMAVVVRARDERNGRAYLWDLVTGQGRHLGRPRKHSSSHTSLAFSSDSKILATGDEDGRIYLSVTG
jgi:WD40 repeat protein